MHFTQSETVWQHSSWEVEYLSLVHKMCAARGSVCVCRSGQGTAARGTK